jgi:hypothetical protein
MGDDVVISSQETLHDALYCDMDDVPVSNHSLRRLVQLLWEKHQEYKQNCQCSQSYSRRDPIVSLQYSFCEELLDIDNYELALNSLTIATIECECQKNRRDFTRSQCTRIFLSAFLQAHTELYPRPKKAEENILKRILKAHDVKDNCTLEEGALKNELTWRIGSRWREDMQNNIESQMQK